MAKKKVAAKKQTSNAAPAAMESLQSIVNGILDREGTLKPSVLIQKVHAIRSDAKPGSISQALFLWKKRKGHAGTRGKKVAAKKMGRPAAKVGGSTSLPNALRLTAALSEVVHIPDEKLADVVRLLAER